MLSLSLNNFFNPNFENQSDKIALIIKTSTAKQGLASPTIKIEYEQTKYHCSFYTPFVANISSAYVQGLCKPYERLESKA